MDLGLNGGRAPGGRSSVWAAIQSNLGAIYSDRIRGERAENLERAIAALEDALTVFTREASPWDWARVQNVLGVTYRETGYRRAWSH